MFACSLRKLSVACCSCSFRLVRPLVCVLRVMQSHRSTAAAPYWNLFASQTFVVVATAGEYCEVSGEMACRGTLKHHHRWAAGGLLSSSLSVASSCHQNWLTPKIDQSITLLATHAKYVQHKDVMLLTDCDWDWLMLLYRSKCKGRKRWRAKDARKCATTNEQMRQQHLTCCAANLCACLSL